MATINKGITLTGFEQVYKALNELPEKLQKKALREAVKKGGEFLADRMAERAPVRTGNLRESVKAFRASFSRSSARIKVGPEVVDKKKALRQRAAGKVVAEVNDGYYAKFLEFGTVKMAARPFMRPALDASDEAIVKIIEEAVKDFTNG